ncbi:MAG: hypothetical protein Q8830_01815 [Candidatus Phytoplasma australasiaticum]|nr:hypothetical protein [Candidatus Phytoplasma australasiaticum]MDV3192137.1 hypothetical protein [Candidatus Phytoplasma australasiaticum]
MAIFIHNRYDYLYYIVRILNKINREINIFSVNLLFNKNFIFYFSCI